MSATVPPERAALRPGTAGPFDPADDLAAWAPHAIGQAAANCTPDCFPYHAAWTYLRLLGLLSSVAKDREFLVRQFRSAAQAGARRVLVSGTADFGQLSLLAHAFRAEGVEPEVTIVDRCGTPLKANRWYAERHRLDVRTRRTDMLDFEGGPFDVVATHNFLQFFAPADRPRLTARWRACLDEGGRLVTVNMVRPSEQPWRPRFDARELAALDERLPRLLRETNALPAGDVAAIKSAIETYGHRHANWSLTTQDDLLEPIIAGGFAIETCSPLTAELASEPNGFASDRRGERFGIVARPV